MRKFILIFFYLTIPLYLFCQQITPEVIVSSGNYIKNDNISITWSLGEIAISTLTDNTMTLTQGFQQPYYWITSITELKKDDRINVLIFPNPTNDFIKVQITNPEGLQILFKMSDVNGRVLLNYKTIDISGIQEFDLQDYAPGIYLLRVWSNDMNYSKTFLIQKISR